MPTSRPQPRTAAAAALAGSLAVASCGPAADGGPLGLGRAEQEFVNGEDDRRELYDVSEAGWRNLVARSVVALMTASDAELLVAGNLERLPTFERREALCPGQRFAEQPAAAFCSGVLVDWDLVLTAGHCLLGGNVDRIRVAFRYYYDEPGRLALAAGDVYRVARVIASRRDPENVSGARLDYAWLELEGYVRPPSAPAPVHVRWPGLEIDAPILSVGSTSGVPLKLDAGARVRDARADVRDYFVADTDTSAGWSGGPAFDEALGLVGNLARGEPDFETTSQGCRIDARGDDPLEAREQFNYAHRAVERLCETGYAGDLCDPECGSPCLALPPETRLSGGGCAFGPPAGEHATGPTGTGAVALLAGSLIISRRKRAARGAAERKEP